MSECGNKWISRQSKKLKYQQEDTGCFFRESTNEIVTKLGRAIQMLTLNFCKVDKS